MKRKLSVDNDRCRRYGFCAAAAPDLFDLTSGGGLRYLRAVPDDRLPEARAAVRECPTLAIVLEERR